MGADSGWDKLLLDTEKLEDKLRDPEEFWSFRRERFLGIARETALQVLLVSRPEEIDADKWERQAHRLSFSVTATLLQTAGARGLVIEWNPPDDMGGPTEARGLVDAAFSLKFEDVEEWIAEGEKGGPDGKRLTQGDQKLIAAGRRSAIASRVMKAYYSKKNDNDGLRRALQEWMARGPGTTFSGYVEGLLDAWVAALGPALYTEFRANVLGPAAFGWSKGW